MTLCETSDDNCGKVNMPKVSNFGTRLYDAMVLVLEQDLCVKDASSTLDHLRQQAQMSGHSRVPCVLG